MKNYIIMIGLLTSTSPVFAQDAERIGELQTQLDTLLKSAHDIQTEIDAMKSGAQTNSTSTSKQPPKPKQIATQVIDKTTNTCAFKDESEITHAVRDEPWMAAKCAGLAIQNSASKTTIVGAEVRQKTDLPLSVFGIAGGPLQPGGARTLLSFGSGANASFRLTKPVFSRLPKDDSFRPQLLSSYLEVSTPISEGKNSIFSGGADDDETTDRFDFASKTSFKAGFDFLNYQSIDYDQAEAAMKKVLEGAIAACKKDSASLKSGNCDRARISNWIFAVSDDNTTPTGKRLKRRELVEKLANIPWRAGEKARPQWGFGGSLEYTTREFDFRQAQFLNPMFDTDAETFNINFAQPLGAKASEGTDNFKAELHGLIYMDLLGPADRKSTPAGKVSGIMFVPQYTYQSSYDFLPKSTSQTCLFADADGNFPDVTTKTLTGCSSVQIDKPRRDQTHTLSLEARTEFINVPFFGKLGTAPKVSYRIDDDQMKAELPLYFLKEQALNSGFRLSFQTGGTNTLNIPEGDDWRFSIFFTPLTFTGF